MKFDLPKLRLRARLVIASKQRAVIQLRGVSRVLRPPTGSCGPVRTPTNELERMQMVAGQLLLLMLQDPF
jgi:hypothetical protein